MLQAMIDIFAAVKDYRRRQTIVGPIQVPHGSEVTLGSRFQHDPGLLCSPPVIVRLRLAYPPLMPSRITGPAGVVRGPFS